MSFFLPLHSNGYGTSRSSGRQAPNVGESAHAQRQSFSANEVGVFTDEDTGELVVSLAAVTADAVELVGLVLRRPPVRAVGRAGGWAESSPPGLTVELGDSDNSCGRDGLEDVRLRRHSLTLTFRPEAGVRVFDREGRLHQPLAELAVRFRVDSHHWRRLNAYLELMIGPDGPLTTWAGDD